MKHAAVKIITMLTSIILVSGLCIFIDAKVTRDKFKRDFYFKWEGVFLKIKDVDDIEKLSVSGYRPDLIAKYKFGDGKWIVAVTSSIMNNDPIAVAMMLDSDGEISIINYEFSGFESLFGGIVEIDAKSLSEFYRKAKHWNIIPYKVNIANQYSPEKR